MKSLILLTLLLSGCQVTSVSMNIDCDQMLGRVGNSCSITVPDSADVMIEGETIMIRYKGK